MHGVPASCFLYRKLIAEQAGRGLRGIAFDLPGLGLAARPDRFDYSWTGLGRFSAAAVDALEPGRFHLVVHDIGGPVGIKLAAVMPDRIRSLTILNTIIEVETLRRPWMMEPFARSHPEAVGLWRAGTEGRRPTSRPPLHAYGESTSSLITGSTPSTSQRENASYS